MITIGAAKGNFFDRKSVLDAVDRATLRVLSRFGAFVRTRARRSIRKRKKESAPGQPPSSHVGLLKDLIFFSYDPDRRSVVIGPTLINRPTGAPALLEYGGTAPGNNRVIFVTRKAGRDAATGRFLSQGKDRIVLTGDLHYAPRPYMTPAFEAEKPGLPAMWANSVR